MTSIQELNPAEIEWLADMSRDLRERGVAGTPQALSDHFAAARDAWFAADEADRPDPNPFINAVGAVIGDMFVVELGLRWVLASDEHGTEAAVFGQPGDILIYPMNAVGKRWAGESGGTLADYIGGVIEAVREVQRANS